jgi:hypothetical protein
VEYGLEQVDAGSRRPALVTPSWVVFVTIGVVEAVLAWSSSELILTRDVFTATLSEQMAPDQIDRALQFAQRFRWVQYVVIAPSLLLRVCVIALGIQLALLVFDGVSVRFGAMFRLTLVAHVAKLVESAVVLIWLAGADGGLRARRVVEGNPLSLGAFVDGSADRLLHDLATTVSAGQIAWVILLAALLRAETGRPMRDMAVSCLIAWALLAASRFAVVEVARLVLG